MRVHTLSCVTLWVVKFDETKKLYTDILGLPIAEESPNFIMFDTKQSRLAFHRLSKGPRLDRQTIELHFEVNNVDEVFQSLQRKGVKFEEMPVNKPWGTRVASFRDPEGYVVEIIGPLKADASDND